MFGTVKLLSVGHRSPLSRWNERWNLLRDLIGGALVLIATAALWTGVWAAVDGPLAPAAQAGARPAAVELAGD